MMENTTTSSRRPETPSGGSTLSPAAQETDHDQRLTVLDLFSGIGGFSLGLERTNGFRTTAFCEIEPFAQRVLAKHWPAVPVFDDVRGVTHAALVERGIRLPEVVCGGFPCQDISLAGHGAGLAGDRSGLWFEYLRIIRELRPRWVIIENVGALLHRGLADVLSGLDSLGYDAEWSCLPAAGIGASHYRDRVWIVANPSGQGMEGPVIGDGLSELGPWGWRGETDLRTVYDSPLDAGRSWPQPLLRRVDDGFSGRVDRLKAIGNSIVPQIATNLGRAILDMEFALTGIDHTKPAVTQVTEIRRKAGRPKEALGGQILAAALAGQSRSDIARSLGCTKLAVNGVLCRARASGIDVPRLKGGPRGPWKYK